MRSRTQVFTIGGVVQISPQKILCLSGVVLVLQCGSVCCRCCVLVWAKTGLWDVTASLGAWPDVSHDGDGLPGKGYPAMMATVSPQEDL